MRRRRLGSATSGALLSLVVVVAAAVLPSPPAAGASSPAAAQAAVTVAVAVAPTCIAPGVATRVVILGAGWGDGPVQLSQTAAPTALGTATARTSPVRGQPGSFSFTATVTAAESFQVSGSQGDVSRSASVTVRTGCPLQVSVKPPCLSAPGTVAVTGTGFLPGNVPIDVDPFGNAEAQPQSATAGPSGTFTATASVAFSGASVPIIASQVSTTGVAVIPTGRAVAFVDPCPPPPATTTTTATTTTKGAPGTTTTATTVVPGATTTSVTTSGPPPPGVPPAIPPVIVPGPGGSIRVSISPYTVRPGRCTVLAVSAAPAGLAVVARLADGLPVSATTGPDGGTVLSVCEPFDSGSRLGPVDVLIGIGTGAPVRVFTVLRVPRRPEPPLLRSGADSRRS